MNAEPGASAEATVSIGITRGLQHANGPGVCPNERDNGGNTLVEQGGVFGKLRERLSAQRNVRLGSLQKWRRRI